MATHHDFVTDLALREAQEFGERLLATVEEFNAEFEKVIFLHFIKAKYIDWTVINAGAEYPSFVVVRNCDQSHTVNNLGFSEYNGQLLTSKEGFINADGNTVGAWRNKKVVVRDPSIKTTYLTSQHPKPKLTIL